MKLLCLTAFTLFGYTSLSQSTSPRIYADTPVQATGHLFKEREADFEYLSSADSSGKRIALKMPKVNGSSALPVLPYPIIFIHGLNSSSETWKTFSDYLDTQFGFSYGGRLDYCLNFDRKNSNANIICGTSAGATADIGLFNATLISGDYYFVNFDAGYNGSFHPQGNAFDVLSNQSAIAKQGVAVKWAIEEVLKKTGREKVVLVAHSMGGLASREYLQNPVLWQADGKHHVAKLVTTGTPHGGSNTTSYGLGIGGIDEQSEAVRDLRSTYYYSKDKGIYLWGGLELQDSTHMNDAYASGRSFYNVDVNSNGITNELLVGLNQKELYSDLDYACIIGKCSGCFISSEAGDGIVSSVNADLKTIYPAAAVHQFYYTAYAASEIHTALPSQIIQNMQGLDEPNVFNLAYHVGIDTVYKGFTSVQSVGATTIDEDYYSFKIEKQGTLSIKVTKTDLTDLTVDMYTESLVKVGSTIHSSGSSIINFNQSLTPGNYYLVISNTPTNISYLHPYAFTLSHTVVAGTGEEYANTHVYIYPNPVTTLLKLQSTGFQPQNPTLEITDIAGKQVVNMPYSSSIDVSSFSKGIYFMKIKTEHQVELLKFIKE